MTSHAIPVAVSADAPFVIERRFSAPLDRVWRAFTEADQLSQWMSPPGMLPAACTVDLRPGGIYHYGMQAPDGSISWGKQTFLDIQPPHEGVAKLVAIVSFSDAHKGVTRHPMAAHWPLQTLATSTFTADGEGTRLHLQWQACNATGDEQAMFNGAHAGMTQGWGGTMAQLDVFLARPQSPSQAPARPDEFVISRVLQGTAQQVFDAFTQPELLSQWWGPWLFDRADVTVDLRVGGQHSIAMVAPDGARYAVKGEFLDIQAPHKLVMTMDCADHPAAWQDMVDPARGSNANPAGVMVQTVWIEPESAAAAPARTRLTVRTRFERTLVRDNMVKLGMPDGWSESLEKLDELVQGILPRAMHMSRLYAHPVERVFAAFCTAEAVAQWWGPTGFTLTTKRFDFRVGGIWQFTMHGPDGTDFPNKVIFTEIDPNRHIAHAHGDDAMGDDGSGAMFQASIRFATFGGMTRVTNHLLLPTREARDALDRQVGAMEGGRQHLAKLANYLDQLVQN